MGDILTQLDDGSLRIRIKAVPGAKQNQIAGVLGDRLKVRISAPPEAGKANKAICQLIARALGVKQRDVSVVSGQTNPEKIIAVDSYSVDQATAQLDIL